MNLTGARIPLYPTQPDKEWYYANAPTVIFDSAQYESELEARNDIAGCKDIFLLHGTPRHLRLLNNGTRIVDTNDAFADPENLIPFFRGRKLWAHVHLLHYATPRRQPKTRKYRDGSSYTSSKVYFAADLTPSNLFYLLPPHIYAQCFPTPYYILLEKICPIEDLRTLLLEFIGIKPII